MEQSRSPCALFVPCPHIDQMDIAENQRSHFPLAQFAQRLQEDSFERLWSCGICQQRNTQSAGLRLDQGDWHPVETHPLAGFIKHRHQGLYLESLPKGTVQGQRGIFASTKTQGTLFRLLHHVDLLLSLIPARAASALFPPLRSW